MALLIPSYPNLYDPASPVANAYGWISGLTLDASTGEGRLTLFIHPSEAASEVAPPLFRVEVQLGQEFAPGDGEGSPRLAFPSLAELMQVPEFAQAYAVIRGVLQVALVANHPALIDATTI